MGTNPGLKVKITLIVSSFDIVLLCIMINRLQRRGAVLGYEDDS